MYCENRNVAAVFGVVSIIVFVLFFSGQAASTAQKVTSGVGKALCVLALVVNAAFIFHATRLCRHMFDQVR
jgi:apolipoprotein N-acyltransferase